jgi:hypothetical protein
MPDKAFIVGAAKRKITPTAAMGPVYRAGYKMGEAEKITGVVDPIFVRCLSIGNESGRVLFFSFDLIGLFQDFRRALAEALSEQGIETSGLIVAATHMHSGPDTMGLWGPSIDVSGCNVEYEKFLIESAVQAAIEAAGSARPSRALISFEEKNLGISNFREPDKLNLSLWQIRFESDEGPVGSLISYPAQPELAPRDDDRISAGYPGAACRLLDESDGGMSLFLLGACGGMEPHGCEKGYDEAHAYGQRMAKELLDMAGRAAPVSGKELSVESVDVRLPVDNPGFQMVMEAGMIRTSHRPPEAVSTVSRIRIGDISIFTTPGESFPGIVEGIDSGADEKGRALFVDQVNDSLGYLIPADKFRHEPVEWAEGRHFIGHEFESLGPAAGDAVRKGLIELASRK